MVELPAVPPLASAFGRRPLLQGGEGPLHGAGGEGGVEVLGEAEADDVRRVVQLHVPGELPRRQLRQVGGHLCGAGPGAGAPLLRDLQVLRIGVHQGQGAPQDDVANAGVVRRFEEDVRASGGAVQHLGRGAFRHGAGEGKGGQVHDGAGILDEGGYRRGVGEVVSGVPGAGEGGDDGPGEGPISRP